MMCDSDSYDTQGSILINSTEVSGCNLIVNYLPQSMSEDEIKSLFATVGNVISCKLVRDRSVPVSLGYAFVNFSHPEEAIQAIGTLDKLKLQNKRLKVSYARPSSPHIKGANVYFSGLPNHFTEEELEKLVSPYGTIINHTILRDQSNLSRGVGFVRFDQKAQADSAVDALHNTTPPGGSASLIVKPANPPKVYQTSSALPLPSSVNGGISSSNGSSHNSISTINSSSSVSATGASRRAYSMQSSSATSTTGPLRHQIQSTSYRYNPVSSGDSSPGMGSNSHSSYPGPTWCIFVYNIPGDSNDALLYQLFSPFGAISSVKVIPDKGYGFVNMVKYEEACNSITRLNGYILGDRMLQVSFKTNKR